MFRGGKAGKSSFKTLLAFSPSSFFFFPAMMWRLSFTCRAHPVLQGGPAGVARAHTSASWFCRPGPCRGGTWNVSWKSRRRLAVPGSGLVNAGAQAPARATAVRRQLSAHTYIYSADVSGVTGNCPTSREARFSRSAGSGLGARAQRASPSSSSETPAARPALSLGPAAGGRGDGDTTRAT